MWFSFAPLYIQAVSIFPYAEKFQKSSQASVLTQQEGEGPQIII